MNPLNAFGIKDRIIIILTLFVVAVIFLSGLWVGLQFTIGSIDTSTKEYSHHGFTGHVELTKTAYATSWRTDGNSETISGTNSYLTKTTSIAYFTNVYYRVFVNGEDVTSKLFGTSTVNAYDGGVIFGSKAVLKPLPPIHLTGVITGYIKVKLYADFTDYFVKNYPNQLMSEDSAYLKSGEGSIQIIDTEQTTTYEEGQAVHFGIQTGFTDGQGWNLKIREPAGRGGSVVYTSPIIDDDKRLTASWTIPDGAFHAGEDNQYTAELWNNLFEECFTTVFVVEDLSKIPSAPILNSTSADGKYTPGTSVTINMQSEANPDGAPIDHFEIWIYYGQAGSMPSHADSYNWIALDETIAATQTSGDNYTGSYTFTIPENHAGNIIVQANALDSDGRASQGSYWLIKTSESAGPTVPNWWYYSTVMTILFVLGAMLAMLAIWWYIPFDYKIKILLTLVALGVTAYMWYSMFGGA